MLFTFTVISIVISLSVYTAWQIAYGSEDNQINLIENLLKERIDFNSIRFNQTDIDNQTDIESKTAYMCIQVDKNSTEKVCKYWNNAQLRIWFLNALRQDDEIQQYFQDLVTKSLQDAFNKTDE